MTREECRALWAAEERTFFQGWDFSHLDGRWEEEALPWSYREELEPYLNYRTVLLDMGTGGGEFLLSLNPPRGRTYATEGYPPNVELCRRRLPIHGIELRQVYDDSDLPFDDGMFDLVINRQEAYDPDEVRRVLKPGGYFVTQQVGGRNNERLAHFLLPGLPEDLRFALVEPLKLLFKDEVRVVGKALGLPDEMVFRQPFPGPGLGVRCLGAITRDRLEAVRESDAILREEFAKNGLADKVWQYFTVVPDFPSVGVKDGARTYAYPVILRAVNTVDAMTATVEDVPFALLQHITARITAEVPGVNRVLYDLTPKPCATIEWE